MRVIPLAAESLGVRSMATYVEVADTAILIDPGATLAPARYGLPPAEAEWEALRRANDRISAYAARARVIFVSHYHEDHFRSDPSTYAGRTILAKEPRRMVAGLQSRRGAALWTASWMWAETPPVRVPAADAAKSEVRDEGAELWVRSGDIEARFSRVHGGLVSVSREGKTWTFGDGFRLAAYIHKRGKFENLSRTLRRPAMWQQGGELGDVEINVRDDERKIGLTWHVNPDGTIALEYNYDFEGDVDVLGQINCLDVWNHERFLIKLQRDAYTDDDARALAEFGI